MNEIIRWPNPILRTPCESVAVGDTSIPALIKEMHEILRLKGGAGLAANQIGVSKRVFVTPAGAYINPRILHGLGKQVSNREGCLSLPGYIDCVPRWEEVQVEYLDPETGMITVRIVTGFESMVFQHEIDHLQGVFFAERAQGGKDRARAFARSHR